MEIYIVGAAIILLLSKAVCQTVLGILNRYQAIHCSHVPPTAIKQVLDDQTFSKSVAYTLAKNRLELFSIWYSTAILALLLFSGILPWLYHNFFCLGQEIAVHRESLFLITTYIFLSISGLPLDYYTQFRLEQSFGFNKSTVRLWITDQLKGFILLLLIAFPLFSLIIYFINTLHWWWIWAFIVVFLLQLVLMVLYPMLILPWFNKLSPLEPGELKDRLLALARKTGFQARTIQVMDGSKRSGHSNAFFTGFGRFRRIVLLDTLVEQMEPQELEAVLAHEIGHYKKGHVLKMLGLSALMLLAGLAVAAWLLQLPVFIESFGFNPQQAGPGPALMLFALLAGLLTFWLSPFLSLLSRKHEYEADRFAAKHGTGQQAMISALNRLHKNNLANLTPHPVYSAFYYSHPTLVERAQALQGN